MQAVGQGVPTAQISRGFAEVSEEAQTPRLPLEETIEKTTCFIQVVF
jgi:hypothetical protein